MIFPECFLLLFFNNFILIISNHINQLALKLLFKKTSTKQPTDPQKQPNTFKNNNKK